MFKELEEDQSNTLLETWGAGAQIIKHKQDREFFKEGFIHKVSNMFKYKLVALSFEGEI